MSHPLAGINFTPYFNGFGSAETDALNLAAAQAQAAAVIAEANAKLEAAKATALQLKAASDKIAATLVTINKSIMAQGKIAGFPFSTWTLDQFFSPTATQNKQLATMSALYSPFNQYMSGPTYQSAQYLYTMLPGFRTVRTKAAAAKAAYVKATAEAALLELQNASAATAASQLAKAALDSANETARVEAQKAAAALEQAEILKASPLPEVQALAKQYEDIAKASTITSEAAKITATKATLSLQIADAKIAAIENIQTKYQELPAVVQETVTKVTNAVSDMAESVSPGITSNKPLLIAAAVGVLWFLKGRK